MKSKFSRIALPALFTAGLIAGAAHVASSNSMATGGHMGHRMHRGMDSLGLPLPMLLHTANLTDAQREQVRKIFESRRESRKACSLEIFKQRAG